MVNVEIGLGRKYTVSRSAGLCSAVARWRPTDSTSEKHIKISGNEDFARSAILLASQAKKRPLHCFLFFFGLVVGFKQFQSAWDEKSVSPGKVTDLIAARDGHCAHDHKFTKRNGESSFGGL